MRSAGSLRRINILLAALVVPALIFLVGVELGRSQRPAVATYVACTHVTGGTAVRCPPQHQGMVLAQFSHGWRLASFDGSRWWIYGAGPPEAAESLPTDWVELAQVQG